MRKKATDVWVNQLKQKYLEHLAQTQLDPGVQMMLSVTLLSLSWLLYEEVKVLSLVASSRGRNILFAR